MGIVLQAQKNFTILHADDHEVVRLGIKTLVQKMPHFQYVDEDISDGDRAMILTQRHQPDVLILDIDMPRSNGVEVARHIMHTKLSTKIVVLSNNLSSYIFEECLSLNVKGFLLKSSSMLELEPCLTAVVLGKQYISKDCLDTEKSFQSSSGQTAHTLVKLLSKSEIKVLKLIALGKSTSEIAEELCNSHRTIESHRYKMTQKLNVKGKYGLLQYAFQNKHVILNLLRK